MPTTGNPIDTEKFSDRMRRAAVDLGAKRVLVTNFRETQQELDLSEPANCNGFGRIRHFRRTTSDGWPPNPLPIDPASLALGLPKTDVIRAQAFQNAVCNWRCWYCYVPFDLLSANPKHSSWLTASELIDLFLAQPMRPSVIDLTGGQPELTPEWVLWMIEEIRARDLEEQVYLWSDDNLSTDHFWRVLTDKEIETVVQAYNYGRVCCFKGYDSESFSFNTLADCSLFDYQFDLFQRYLKTGMDLYAYVTLTSPTVDSVGGKMRIFVDKLQNIHPNLPLRTIPLEILKFTPVHSRIGKPQFSALDNQQVAIEAWNAELNERFSSESRSQTITNVSITI